MVRGWKVGINPELLQSKISALVFRVGSGLAKEDVIRKVRLVDGVFGILDFFGDTLTLILLHDTESALDRQIELVCQIADARDVERLRPVQWPPEIRLDRTDLLIIKCLQSDHKKPYVDVAKSLGLSSRTVKRRVTRLIEHRALFIAPEIDLKSVTGAVCADLVVHYADAQVKKQLDARIAERYDDFMLRGGLGWGNTDTSC